MLLHVQTQLVLQAEATATVITDEWKLSGMDPPVQGDLMSKIPTLTANVAKVTLHASVLYV